MKLKRIVGAVLIASLGLATLTACDPPYPPELIETIYEQNPVCEAGVVPIQAPGKTEQLVSTFNDTMAGQCQDMSISLDNANPEISFSSSKPTGTEPGVYAATPLFVDGGVAVINFSSGVSLTLSLDVLFKVLSGDITAWNDPAILALNKKIDPVDLPVIVNPVADQNSLGALESWAKLANVSVPATLLTKPEDNPSVDLTSVAEGTISILPLSEVLNQGGTPSSIKVKSKYLNGVIAPTDSTLFAGASQFKATNNGPVLELVQDPALTPELPKGGQTADVPYQAVFFGWQLLKGADNLRTRAVGRFLLRMDEQGTLPAVSLIGLPTKIRQAATALVSKGLKLPKVTIKK
jgi:hypothetical protein